MRTTRSTAGRLLLALWFAGVVLLALYNTPASGQTPQNYISALPLLSRIAPFLGEPPLSGYLGLVVAGEGSAAELYMVRAEGGEPHRLTDNTLADYAPAWSPDNRTIAFARETSEGNGISQAMLMDADGANTRLLTPELTGTLHHFQWSPDGQYILGEARMPGQDENLRRLVVLSTSGALIAQVPEAFSAMYRYWQWQTDWSPDGNYFHYRNSNGTHIYSLDEQRVVASHTGHASDILWTPDSRAIVLSGATRYGDYVPLDGSPPRNLFTGPYSVEGWLSGGESLLLHNWNNYQLYSLPITGGEMTQVSAGGAWFMGIAPDTTTLLYHDWSSPSERDIVLHPLGGEPRPITQQTCNTTDGSCIPQPGALWSPDGSRLLYLVNISDYRYSHSYWYVAETNRYTPAAPLITGSADFSNLRFLPGSNQFAAATGSTGYPAYDPVDTLADVLAAQPIEIHYPDGWHGLVEWRYVP